MSHTFEEVRDRGRLQYASDVVALASVTRGEREAFMLAEEIGVRIRDLSVSGNVVTVVVTGLGLEATSSASR